MYRNTFTEYASIDKVIREMKDVERGERGSKGKNKVTRGRNGEKRRKEKRNNIGGKAFRDKEDIVNFLKRWWK